MTRDKQIISDTIFIVFTLTVVSAFVWANFFYTPAQVDLLEASLKKENKINIITDKTKYALGETVKIAFVNNTGSRIGQQSIKASGLPSKKFLGNNYSVGLIERLNQEAWEIIEPVMRCAESCSTDCDFDEAIPPGTAKIFNWAQTIMDCGPSSEPAAVSSVPAGKYRVSTAIWLPAVKNYKLVYSQPFLITN